MGKIHQTLTDDEAIAIMNKMICETAISETLTEFQGSYGLVGRNWQQAV